MQKEKIHGLESVRAELESWRRQRKGKERIPERFWTHALALLTQHSVYQVSRALKLDPRQLQKRSQPAGQVVRHNRKSRKAFLEISGGELAGTIQSIPKPETKAAAGAQLCQFVFELNDGGRLTLNLPADSSLIESICQAFFRNSAI